MSIPSLYGLSLQDCLSAALLEDCGDGDHTSLATIDKNLKGKAEIKVKENGILAGMDVALEVLRLTDPGIQTQCLKQDGDQILSPQIVMKLEGTVQSLLKAERLLLNCLQRMSGIATLTAKFVKAVEGTGVKILDTRKTTPNFRMFEKQAVRTGGGYNHRFGLYDMILIKDNHVDASGGIKNAIQRANDYLKEKGKTLQIEIEVRNPDELEEVLRFGCVNRIMLDNFTTEQLKSATAKINKRFETEASGGINLENVRNFALCGVDFISVGALTHSYKSLDINLKISK